MPNDQLSHDPRHVARALALQQLFADIVAAQPAPDASELLSELEQPEYDNSLMQAIVDGVKLSYQVIDPVIQVLAPAWPLEQIAPVDLIVLRMGIWEGFIAKRNPLKVVINEMIELAKQFGGNTSGSFVNGVLGSLALREDLQEQLIAQLTPAVADIAPDAEIAAQNPNTDIETSHESQLETTAEVTADSN
jgi:N utilization substance protein B